ncbi:MAG: F0F1 ATP synthase subunit A [Butyrivibrio sp.]|nr:F0F1 ATP synthase subunit A [Butyrivibrio sp.]
MNIGEELNALLTEDKTAIHVNVPFFPEGFWDINKSIVISWGVIVLCLLLCLILTSGMKLHGISKRQAMAEAIVVGLRNVVSGLVGPGGSEYVEYLISVMIFIAFCNLAGVFGLTPPTMDLNITIALALMSIILVEVAGIRKRGPRGWLKSFTQPIWIITPMNILEIGIKPLSLCMRLFGNILGATVIMELIRMVIPIGVPTVVSLYFEFFDGIIQAYVFIFLTSLYISEATEEEAE